MPHQSAKKQETHPQPGRGGGGGRSGRPRTLVCVCVCVIGRDPAQSVKTHCGYIRHPEASDPGRAVGFLGGGAEAGRVGTVRGAWRGLKL